VGGRTSGTFQHMRLAAALFALLLLGIFVSAGRADGGASSTAPTVATDSAAYVPGDTVHVTGSGWVPNETIHVHAAADGHSFAYDTDVVASIDGGVDVSFDLPSDYADTFAVVLSNALQGSISTSFSDAFAAASSAPPPTIASDKADYSPGSTVTLTGANWTAGEVVHVVVNDTVGQTWQFAGDATADAHGAFTLQILLPNYFVSDYDVTATGAAGERATAAFTDGNVTLHLSTAEGAADMTVTIDKYTGNTTCGLSTPSSTVTATASAGGTVNIPGFGGSGDSARLKSVTTTTSGKTFSSWTSGTQTTDSGTVVPGSPTPCVSNSAGGSNGNLSDLYAHFVSSIQTTSLSTSAATGTYGGTVNLSATLTVGASGVSGKTITFKLNGTTVGTGTTNASGVATLNGASLSGINAGSYPSGVSASFAGDSGSTASNASAALTVNSKAATATADNQSKTYGQSDPSFTFSTSGVLSGDTLTGVTCGVTGAHANVGSYDITCSGNTNGNYSVTYAQGTLNVNTKAATATADNKSIGYGQTDPTFTFTPSGALAGDTLTGVTCGVTGAHANAGSYDITCSGNTNANYSVTYVKGTLTVTARAITVTADAKSKTYGNADPALTYQLTSGSLAGGDSFSGALTRDPGENVDLYDIKQGTLTAGANYALTFVGAKLTIDQRPITVTADAKSKTYGNADPALTYQVTSGSLAFSDTIAGALTRDAGENVGQHDITQGTLTAGANYALTFVGAKLTIDQRPITVTAGAKSKTYGDADPALTYQLASGSLAFSDTITGALTRDAGENVGQYDIKQGTVTAGASYALTFVGAKLTITKATLAINADGKTKVYGDANPAPTYSFSGFKLSDSAGNVTINGAADCSYAAGSGPDVSVYPGAISCGPGDLSASNYDFAGGGKGSLTITVRPVEITADAKSKTYSDADPTLTFHVSSGSLAYSDALSGALARDAGEDVGEYAITQGSVALNSNYALSFVGAKFTIDKRAVEVTADPQSKTYGDADPVLTYQITKGSIALGDAFSGGLTRDTGSAVGQSDIHQGTLTLGVNYDLSFVGAKLTITKATLAIDAASKSKVYGEDNPAPTYSFSGFVNGDDAGAVTITGSADCSYAFGSGPNVATYDGAISCGPGDLSAANYDFASGLKGDLTITQRSVAVTADPQSKTYGDADPALAYHISSGSLAYSDSFSGSLTRDAGEDVGQYDIHQGSLTLGVNYDLTFQGAKLTIGKRSVEITADPKHKTYGDADPPLNFQITDGSRAFGDLFSGALARDAGQDVGQYDITQGTVALSDNYSLVYKAAKLTIEKRPVEVTADPQSKTYGDADPALTYQITNGSLVYTDGFAGSLARDAGESVGQYDIAQGTLTLGDNYELTFKGDKLTIGKRHVEITADPQSKTYGNADPALTFQITHGSLAYTDGLTGNLARDAGENVGDYDITQGTVALNSNYALTFIGAKLTINQRPVEVTADPQTKVYGNADPELTYKVTHGSVVTGDSFTGSLSRAAGEDVDSYDITQGSLTLGGNYDVSFVGDKLMITKRPVTITADPKNKTYGDDDPELTFHISNGSLVFSDAFSGSLARDAGEDFGPYAITQGSVALSDNYDLSFVGAELTIGKRHVEVTADAQSKTYGDDDPNFTYQITDGSLAFSDGFSGVLTREAGKDVGTYEIQQGSLTLGGNYELSFVGAKLTITQRPVTVTAGAKSKTYGNADPALTYDVTSGSLAYSDTFSGGLTRDAGEDVGHYAITQGTLALSSNYDLDYVGAELTIEKRPVEITAGAKSKTYGDADPALTYQISSGSLAFSDAFTGSLMRDAGEDVGGYAIKQGTVALSDNYMLTFVGANLSITKRAVEITADNKAKVYGDPDPALTYAITKGSLAFTDAFSGSLTRDPGESVAGGPYAIAQGTVALNGNYDLSFVPGTLTIGKATLAINADGQTKVYGNANPTPTYSFSGFKFSDTPGTVTITGDASCSYAGAGPAVGYYVGEISCGPGTLSAANYDFAGGLKGSLTITKRPVEITADAQGKTYGDGDPELTYQITSGNLVYGDAFSGHLARNAGEAVGDYPITQGMVALSSNYTLAYKGANLTITKRQIAITADAKSKTYGNADPALTFQISSGSLAFSDHFTGALARDLGQDVGQYAITQGTVDLNPNYELTYNGAKLTIGQRPVTIAADVKSKCTATPIRR
jgi:large repetitive protein